MGWSWVTLYHFGLKSGVFLSKSYFSYKDLIKAAWLQRSDCTGQPISKDVMCKLDVHDDSPDFFS